MVGLLQQFEPSVIQRAENFNERILPCAWAVHGVVQLLREVAVQGQHAADNHVLKAASQLFF
jgi:hypothetical protein